MTPANENADSTRDGVTLFALSFLSLFLELVFIRYLPANILNLGFYPNVVLLSAFLGIAAGFLLHQHVPLRLSLGLQVAGAFLIFLMVETSLQVASYIPWLETMGSEVSGEVYVSDFARQGAGRPEVLVALLLCNVLVFFLLAQRIAKFFARFAPLRAYAIDILGSCAGVVAFMLLSQLETPPYVWFLVLAVAFAASMPMDQGISRWALVPLAACVLHLSYRDAAVQWDPTKPGASDLRWSPYQRVEFHEADNFGISVNGIGHQSMRPPIALYGRFYHFPYLDREKDPATSTYENVLVMGAGSGNDVAMALLMGARHVDAVEIDPVIADMGRLYHPLQPYSDPRVDLTIDDARSFMARTTRHYDLIIFALTDSLVRISAMSQLRLENYLFTQESVDKARTLLTPTGDMVFYNTYGKPWVIWKIQELVRNSTGNYPKVLLKDVPSVFRVMSAGHSNAQGGSPPEAQGPVDVPTDDWPFLYLRQRGIPDTYAAVMASACILLVALMLLLHFLGNRRAPGRASLAHKGAFLLMGVAFLLLETKSIIRFSLLFGTTWRNASFVMLAVLVMILIATRVSDAMPNTRTVLAVVFVLLLATSALGVVLPLNLLSGIPSGTLKLLAASLLTFSPILFANVLFGLAFKDHPGSEHTMGWNLVGAALGGVLEYFSMAWGYNALGVLVGACYAAAFLLLILRRGPPAHAVHS